MFLKIVKLIVLVVLVTFLTACGSSGGSSESTDDTKDDGRSNLTTEGAGNTNSVEDKDITAPIITILGENPISITQYSTYRDVGATAKDKVDGNVIVVARGSVNSSTLGQYIIVYTATNKAGKKATEKRVVTVIKKATIVDITAPIITILGNNPMSVVQYSTYKDAGATAKDTVDGVILVKSSGFVDTSVVKNHFITYTATDKKGNKTIAKRTVKVIKKEVAIDRTSPVITILGKNPVTIVQNSIYKDAGATAKDNIDGTVIVKINGSVNTSVIKNYIMTYTAIDKSGNRAIAKRTVKVIKKVVVADITAPVITIIGDNPASVIQNSIYKDAGAIAKDTIDGTVGVKTTGSVDTSVLGEYTITYKATDKAGNKVTKTRKVNVTLPPDTTLPIIKISGENPFEISQGETFADPGATATDNRDGVITVIPTGKVDMSTVGDYTITYTATDKAGNEINATRTVTVIPADVVWNVSNITEFRQALEDAAANGESDRIVLSKGTYNVASDGLGTLAFDDNEAFNLTIEALEGLTHKDVILDGNHSKQIFNFNNTKSSTLTLKNISVIDANSTENGAVYTNQNIKVKDCNISNNISSSGGFYSAGTTNISNSTILHNSNRGFYSNGATIISNSIISNNNANSRTGGGGFYSNGTTTVSNSTISNNSAKTSSGGGFYSSGITTITTSIISNNYSNNNYYYLYRNYAGGGGFHSHGSTTIISSTVSNNKSKGVYSNGGGFYSTGTASVKNSTISNNSSNNNGGGFYTSSITINRSTINNNYAKSNGGGFYGNNATVINSIFSENNATTGATFYAFKEKTYYKSFLPSYIGNNTFVKNRGSIYSRGIFVNNIFSENDEDVTLVGVSKIYNNYIDYSKIEDNGHNVIKKKNLQPASVGEIYLTSKYTLESESPVIDKGLNPSSATYKKIIGAEQGSYNYNTREYDIVYTQYNKMLELLKTDKVGNKRVHNSAIDIGAVEYGSSK